MSANAATPVDAAKRRQVLLLTGLLAILAVLVLFQVLPMLGSVGSGGAPSSAPANGAAGPARRAAGAKSGPVEEVALAKLQQPWPEPTTSRRNPFTMAADPPPPPPPASAAPAKPVEPVDAQPVGPPPPPPVPPITLKFIGTVSGPGNVGKIAALSDGKFVYRGREGSVVEGRYRIVKIGEESIQIEYANGTGRQTIRLSGK